MSLSPIVASKRITEKYKRYLRTIFPISDRVYARQFEEALADESAYEAGPYLSVTDSFIKGSSIRELVDSGILAAGFDKINMPYDRPLYKHQQIAVEKSCRGGNIVVSTGTGSGKTECFLIPIFSHLIRELATGTLSKGVRALIIYPMNALANDQTERLRKVLADMPQITFGSYTGQTKDRYEEALAEYKALNDNKTPLRNELISREQIREVPPHILITNYAMLEYLMIRPRESVFFLDEYAKRWKFVVLDEAHVYNGSTGIEVSMLLRRLKARLKNDSLQYILTSATLGGDGDNKDVAEFARQLCDSPFYPEDVIRAMRVIPSYECAAYTLPSKFYTETAEMLRRNAKEPELFQLIEKYTSIDKDKPYAEFLYNVVERDQSYHKMRRYLKEPQTISSLAHLMSWKQDEIVDFVTVASQCKKNEDRLFDARYHMFLRATDSVFITLAPNKRLFLNRKNMHYEGEEEFKVFEIATCTSCGAIYLSGKVVDGRLEQNNVMDENSPRVLYLLSDRISDMDDDHPLEQENIESEEYEICARCGHLRSPGIRGSCCEHGEHSYVRVFRVRVSERTKVLTKCLSCEKVSSYGVLRMFFTGQEAVTSVIGTALYEEIPSHKITQEYVAVEEDDTGFGFAAHVPQIYRKERAKQFIAFSDNRQAAAFYASYLDQTYRSILYKRLIVEALKEIPHGVKKSVAEFADDLICQFEHYGIAMGKNQSSTKEAWKAILAEMVNNNDSNSLYSLGMLELSVNDERIVANNKLELSKEDVAALYSVLALGMMADAALMYPINLTRADKEYFTYSGVEYSYTLSDANPKAYQKSFIPTKAHRTNKRLAYLLRVLEKKGKPVTRERGVFILEKIWQNVFCDAISGLASLNRNGNGAFRLNVEQLRIGTGGEWYVCSKCHKTTPHNVAGVCPTFECDGMLQPAILTQLFADNHYYRLYRNLDIREMRVKEHTAQLDRETAYEYQKQFQQKQIDVLSCSTTFEMGVDVGTLETVFMRNMPPSPANYAQRAGRAGRSKETAAYAITFCNKSSHDFTFFKNPGDMINGKILPPKFVIENEKIAIRHVYASAFGFFWRQYPQYFNKAADMAEVQGHEVRGIDCFKRFIQSKPEDLKEYLRRFLPRRLVERFDIDRFGWIDGLVGEEGVLTKAVEIYEYEVGILEEAREYARMKDLRVDGMSARLRVYRNEKVLPFLSRRNVLPKYGFPVDTVEMMAIDRTGSGNLGIQLQRDLSMAISEYAPGSQVVANGRLLTSRYIRKIPRMSWKMFDYVQCKCNTLNIAPNTGNPAESTLTVCSQCGSSLGHYIRTFLIPEFGFETDGNCDEKPGLTKPERTYRSEPAFLRYVDQTQMHEYHIGSADIRLSISDLGEMAMLNDSNFYVCETCGYADLNESCYMSKCKAEHKNSSGFMCNNKTLRRYSLGYRFLTDVVVLQFITPDLDNREIAISVMYGLLKGIYYHLHIEESEISGCLQYYLNPDTRQGNYGLVLFDRTPGGAGHVRRLDDAKVLEGVLRTTLRLMSRCDCGGEAADSSCYSCLRGYYNQKHHDTLKRAYIIDFLKSFL